MTKMNDNTVPFGKLLKRLFAILSWNMTILYILVSLPGILMIIEHWLWEEKRELKPGRKIVYLKV